MDTKVLLGQNSIMKCKVSSDPTVLYQIDWFHNNKYVYNYFKCSFIYIYIYFFSLYNVLEVLVQAILELEFLLMAH